MEVDGSLFVGWLQWSEGREMVSGVEERSDRAEEEHENEKPPGGCVQAAEEEKSAKPKEGGGRRLSFEKWVCRVKFFLGFVPLFFCQKYPPLLS